MKYKPDLPYDTPVLLFNPILKKVKGVTVKTYPEKGELIFCKFKTYGGTESIVNGQLTVIDTANVETWYRPDITSGSQIRLGSDVYEVMGKPEDVEQRHEILKFKVRGVSGGA